MASVLVVQSSGDGLRELVDHLVLRGLAVAGVVPLDDRAVSLAEQVRPDLAVVDAPADSPAEALAVTRTLQERLGVPVLLLVPPDPAGLAVARRAQPAACLSQPPRAADLDAAVAAVQGHARHAAERDLHELAAHLPDALVVVAAGRVLHANPAFAAATGSADGASLLGAELALLLHEDDRAATLGWLEQVAQGTAVIPVRECHALRPDGTTVLLELAAAAVTRFRGSPAVLVLGRDITERKHALSRQAVEDRLTSVGTMAAGVAHEINNPLTFVIGNVGLVARELESMVPWLSPPAGAPPPPARSLADLGARLGELAEALDDALAGAERVRNIVRDLSTFSRAPDQQRTLVRIPPLLDTTLNLAWSEIRYRARLVEDYAAVPPVLANAARLGQVFLNLLLNAAQAIPENHVDRHEIRVATGTDTEGRAVVEITDTGSGIAPEHRAQLFNPFFTTKAVGEGTGLGLAICHEVVTALGGEIQVESQLGHGSTFRVVLPAAPAESAPAEHPAAAPRLVKRRARLLLVDDEALVAGSLRRLLAPHHDVEVETSARAALARLQGGERYDVVLCDLMMPEMTGMELFHALEQVAPDVVPRVVFMSGGVFSTAAREFLDRVANPHIEKPVDTAVLLRLIAERLTTTLPPPPASSG